MNSSAKLIYKICDAALWASAEKKGVFHGAEIDLTDGYIHFSTADQVESTLGKHFVGRTDLMLVAVNTEELGDKIVYEQARDGALFPHLYEPLSISYVAWVKPIRVDDGRHIVPQL